jgi:CRISPR-associated protein Csb3
VSSASIPVDLLNPGQVLASLGFLEAAHVLCGAAEGGFDWSDVGDSRFLLVADGSQSPFAAVLEFLAEAEVSRSSPDGYRDGPKATDRDIRLTPSACFPAPQPDPMCLPISLEHDGRRLSLAHWCDRSTRDSFKLYAGNRSAASIARAMLCGDSKHKTSGIRALVDEDPERLFEAPFDVVTPLGGSFNFDPRAAWTRLDAGYSPNDHKHLVSASPVVEILAAIGLQHARPWRAAQSDDVRYAAWAGPLLPSLARAALGCTQAAARLRTFQFTLARSGKNKVVTFAREQIA